MACIDISSAGQGIVDLAPVLPQAGERPLERDSTGLNRIWGFPTVGKSDSRCWLELEASMHARTLFAGFTRACDCVGQAGDVAARGGAAVRSWGFDRDQLGSPGPGDRERGGRADGRRPAVAADR